MNEIPSIVHIKFSKLEPEKIILSGFYHSRPQWDEAHSEFLGIHPEEAIEVLKSLNIPHVYDDDYKCENCFVFHKTLNTKLAHYSQIELPWQCLGKYQKRFIEYMHRESPEIPIKISGKVLFIMLCDDCIHDAFEVANRNVQRFASSSKHPKCLSSETDIEDILFQNPELIESGMKIVRRQHKIDGGRIDLLATDKKGVQCIIELKNNTHDERLVMQCLYYPTQFDKPNRMIAIAPGYSQKNYPILRSNGVELKVFEIDDNDIFYVRDFVPLFEREAV